jgi:L-cysteine desulfidase
MTLAGSGNKGITVAVALACWAEELGVSSELADEALALAALVTSVTTRRLGTLSAMCGCANAAGMGLAAGLVRLHGGGERELELAVGNLVGTVTGVICDGAKVGCGLKATTAVDTAHRAASLALSGFGVSAGDGIVAARGEGSLDNLERIARQGLRSMDAEVLAILRETPRNGAPGGR